MANVYILMYIHLEPTIRLLGYFSRQICNTQNTCSQLAADAHVANRPATATASAGFLLGLQFCTFGAAAACRVSDLLQGPIR